MITLAYWNYRAAMPGDFSHVLDATVSPADVLDLEVPEPLEASSTLVRWQWDSTSWARLESLEALEETLRAQVPS